MGREKAKRIACYTCLVPLCICSNSSSMAMMGFSNRYGDIVLPVVEVVLCDQALLERVCSKLGIDCTDIPKLELSLCSSYAYKGEKVFLA